MYWAIERIELLFYASQSVEWPDNPRLFNSIMAMLSVNFGSFHFVCVPICIYERLSLWHWAFILPYYSHEVLVQCYNIISAYMTCTYSKNGHVKMQQIDFI